MWRHTRGMAIGRTGVQQYSNIDERCCPLLPSSLPRIHDTLVVRYDLRVLVRNIYDLFLDILAGIFIYMIFTGIIILKNGIENGKNGISQRARALSGVGGTWIYVFTCSPLFSTIVLVLQYTYTYTLKYTV